MQEKKESVPILEHSLAVWCHEESNRGHKDFQSFALPSELWHHIRQHVCYVCGAKIGKNSDFANVIGKKYIFYNGGYRVSGMDSPLKFVPETLREPYVADVDGLCEQRCNLRRRKTGNAATYLRNEKFQFRVPACEVDKLIDIRPYRLHAALHGRDGIAAPVQPYTLSPYGSEPHKGKPCRTAAVHAGKVAAEDEHLVIGQ